MAVTIDTPLLDTGNESLKRAVSNGILNHVLQMREAQAMKSETRTPGGGSLKNAGTRLKKLEKRISGLNEKEVKHVPIISLDGTVDPQSEKDHQDYLKSGSKSPFIWFTFHRKPFQPSEEGIEQQVPLKKLGPVGTRSLHDGRRRRKSDLMLETLL